MTPDNQLYSGTLADFSDSMASEIESAYNALLTAAGKDPLPTEDTADRRLLFVAIARGVINHLQKKRKALAVSVPVSTSLPATVPLAVNVRTPSD